MKYITLVLSFLAISLGAAPKVEVGMDVLIEKHGQLLKKKNIGLVTNHTAINSNMDSSIELLLANSKKLGYNLKALFAPEHGLNGNAYAYEYISNEKRESIPVYSLHGSTRRPNDNMLENLDLLIFDIQDVGVRSYTYASTLFYIMEEAAKRDISVIVTDRPNPINGTTVDGPMLDEKWRSFVGYIDVPYCHGMTVGELARYFNGEYKTNCNLTVIPMNGWKRTMDFTSTGLTWIPTSPQIPENDTPLYYATTGILGETLMVSIGVGYTLPFKLVGAPWIDAEEYAQNLNSQNFSGVYFLPFHFKPYFGRYEGENCHGVKIIVTKPEVYKPISTQYLLLGTVKNLYPEKFQENLLFDQPKRRNMFCKINGTDKTIPIIQDEQYITWKLIGLDEVRRKNFIKVRQKYLIY